MIRDKVVLQHPTTKKIWQKVGKLCSELVYSNHGVSNAFETYMDLFSPVSSTAGSSSGGGGNNIKGAPYSASHLLLLS